MNNPNIWFIALMIIFAVVAASMVLIILMQRPHGGGLAAAFGGAGAGSGDSVFGGRVGDALTWATVIAFVLFIGLGLGLNVVSPSKPVAPRGACCFSDGTTCAETTEDECEGAGGTWMGSGTNCQTTDCPLPTTEMEAPGTTPGTDAPGTDAPGTDTPGTDAPGTDAPGTDTPGTDAPGTDTPGTDTPGTQTPATDETEGGDEDSAPSDDRDTDGQPE